MTLRAPLQAVADEGVLFDNRIVADLIDQAVVIVARDIIISEFKASIIRVGPEPYTVIVVYPVVLDNRVLYVPELPAAGAAAVGRMRLPVVRVIASDLVILQHQVHRTVRRVRVEAVLLVVGQAVVRERIVAAQHDGGAGVVLERRVIHGPSRRRVHVDDTLVLVLAFAAEVLHRQIADGHAGGRTAEGIEVVVPSVQDGTRSADVS